MYVRREVSQGSHVGLVRSKLSSGGAGAGTLLQDRERHGCRARAHTDVLAASPEERYPHDLGSPVEAAITVQVKLSSEGVSRPKL